VFESIKPLHVSVFFTTIFRGSSAGLCGRTIPPADLQSTGGIVTAQSTAENPLKMVMKKDRNI